MGLRSRDDGRWFTPLRTMGGLVLFLAFHELSGGCFFLEDDIKYIAKYRSRLSSFFRLLLFGYLQLLGMLEEETRSTSTPLSVSVIHALIGPFLSDIGVEDVNLVCQKIAKSITDMDNGSKCRNNDAPSCGGSPATWSELMNGSSSKGTTTPSTNNNCSIDGNSNSSSVIRKPFSAGDFLNDAANGYVDPYLGLQVSH